METIFKKKQSTGKESFLNLVPEIKNQTKEFLIKMKALSQAQKINLVYSNLTKKKPNPNMDLTRKLNRILFEQKFGDKIKQTEKRLKGKKQFRWSFKQKAIFKNKKKKKKEVLVWFLRVNGEIELPKYYPLYYQDMIIIKGKPYKVDPRMFWRMGKNMVLIVKEIDRIPVSNLDYEEVKFYNRSTENDKLIIKAAMQAKMKKDERKPINKNVMIVIGIIVIAAIIYFTTK